MQPPSNSLSQHYSYPYYRLLVFAKAPILGFAKTRLQPQLSQDFSLALHCRLSRIALTQWSQSNICPIECWVAGDRRVFCEKILEANEPDLTSLPVHQQVEGNLGERLIYALNNTFNANKPNGSQALQGVFLVGTDCPFIDSGYLHTACEQLRQHDVVIGPAEDGGYVLLGLKFANEALFRGIAWGESSVLASTIAKLKASGLSYFELPMLSDIDQAEDLEKLKAHGGFSDLLAQRPSN